MLSRQDTHTQDPMQTLPSQGKLVSRMEGSMAQARSEHSLFMTPTQLSGVLGSNASSRNAHSTRPLHTTQTPIGLRHSLNPTSEVSSDHSPMNAFWGEALEQREAQASLSLPFATLWANRQAILQQCWEAPLTQYMLQWIRQPASVVLCGLFMTLIISSMWVKDTRIDSPTRQGMTQDTRMAQAAFSHGSHAREGNRPSNVQEGFSDDTSYRQDELALLAQQGQDDSRLGEVPFEQQTPENQTMLAKAWAGLQRMMPGGKEASSPLGGSFDSPYSGGEKIVEQKITASSQGGQRLNPFQQLLIQKKIQPPPPPQQDSFVDSTPVNDTPEDTQPVAPPDSLQGVVLRGIIRHRSGDIEAVIVSHQGRSYTLRPGKEETINAHKVVLESATDESASFSVDGFERKELILEDVLTAESAPAASQNNEGGVDAGQQNVGYPGGGGQQGGFDPNRGFTPPGFTFRPHKGMQRTMGLTKQGYRLSPQHGNTLPTRGYTVIKLH